MESSLVIVLAADEVNARAPGNQRVRHALLHPLHGENVMQVKQIAGNGPTSG